MVRFYGSMNQQLSAFSVLFGGVNSPSSAQKKRCCTIQSGLGATFCLSKLKGTHMKCPTCSDIPLVMAERQGVEIDYCPSCRGIWLDRGELDKLLERAVAAAPVMVAPIHQAGQSAATPPHQHLDGDQRFRYEDRGAYKRKKSWLHEIFD
jgi:Zn-finger nucleic acid-binding protein